MYLHDWIAELKSSETKDVFKVFKENKKIFLCRIRENLKKKIEREKSREKDLKKRSKEKDQKKRI